MAKLERIKEIEAEIQRTQKNKATEYHLGRLKAQLAKLRGALIEESQKASGGPKDGFDVARTGDARVALVGLPSVGKSSLVQSLTAANTQVAEYAFTTLTCVPGLLYYKDAKIQILDLPGIIEGASENKGRGKQVISTIKSADIILMILDPTTSNLHDNRRLLEKELNTLNIRLNKRRPDAQVSVKKSGGIKISTTVPLTKTNINSLNGILMELNKNNVDVVIRENLSEQDFIDVVCGKIKYMKCLYVYNKCDMLTLTEIKYLAERPMSVCISCKEEWNLDLLLRRVLSELQLIRVITKKKGEPPDFSRPLILNKNNSKYTIEDAIIKVHSDLLKEVQSALVWGTSVKFNPQIVGLEHELEDDDVVEFVRKSTAQK